MKDYLIRAAIFAIFLATAQAAQAQVEKIEMKIDGYLCGF